MKAPCFHTGCASPMARGGAENESRRAVTGVQALAPAAPRARSPWTRNALRDDAVDVDDENKDIVDSNDWLKQLARQRAERRK